MLNSPACASYLPLIRLTEQMLTAVMSEDWPHLIDLLPIYQRLSQTLMTRTSSPVTPVEQQSAQNDPVTQASLARLLRNQAQLQQLLRARCTHLVALIGAIRHQQHQLDSYQAIALLTD